MNNKVFFLLLLNILFIRLSAQDSTSIFELELNKNKPKVFHMGIGTGLNSSCGLLGINLEILPSSYPKISLSAGLGLSTWGLKSSLGLRYYNRGFPHRIFYGLAYTSSSGIGETDFEQNIGETSNTETITVETFRAQNIALSMGYQFRLFRNGRLGLELGYSIPFKEKAYEPVSYSPELSTNTENMLQALSPGGFILGLVFSIGIR